jgi:hypothetical protein
MTSETRTFIGAADVSGIEVECPKCGLTIFYPIGGEKTLDILAGCPHCSHQFFDAKSDARGFGHPEFPAINELQKFAASLRTLLRSDRTDIHANIRFRIDAEAAANKREDNRSGN